MSLIIPKPGEPLVQIRPNSNSDLLRHDCGSISWNLHVRAAVDGRGAITEIICNGCNAARRVDPNGAFVDAQGKHTDMKGDPIP